MEGDEIRKLLIDLPGHSYAAMPPGHKAIVCSAIEDAGAEPDEVERWIEEAGGWREEVEPGQATLLSAGEMAQAPLPLACYLVVPLEALRNG